jgi:hypothetical protein
MHISFLISPGMIYKVKVEFYFNYNKILRQKKANLNINLNVYMHLIYFKHIQYSKLI